ncbi:hypothetical protein ACH50O_02950 [Methylomonas sp. 2BW1-5-20]|uniref:hypothetical protein n=1 Tax=Methylomonas sp. 2BW1-5-20 TaxID=3376686 RepID=UPI0040513B69
MYSSIVNKTASRQQLEAAISGLRGLTAQALGYDRSAIEHFAQSLCWAESILDEVNGVAQPDTSAEMAMMDRGLVGAVALRAFSIGADIEREQQLGQSFINAHAEKVTELRRQGYTGDEALLMAPFPQINIDAFAANIADLAAEREKLEAFLASPGFDTRVLSGTQFEQPEPVSH